MVRIQRLLAILLLAMSFAGLSYASGAVVGTSSIYAPAVILENNTGTITAISLTVSQGMGNVIVLGPSDVGHSTLVSARTAAEAASAYLGKNFSDYNFTYSIYGAVNVSGPSGGLAMALLAVSALEGKVLPSNFTVTGMITANGYVGQIGGIYDKASAAHSEGLSYMLVPYAGSIGFESELYMMAQSALGMPLVQVSNLSQAVGYAYDPSAAMVHPTSYDLYTNYAQVGKANGSCSVQCTAKQFGALANFTFNFTAQEIGSLSASPNMDGVQAQMYKALNQSKEIAGNGYLYLGANLAFLDYINAFLFSHVAESVQGAVSLINGTKAYCSSISPPNLTTTNYEYVLGGELRQQWGLITLSNELNASNTTGLDSDQVSTLVNGVAQANAWCKSANHMYNIASGLGGNAIAVTGISKLASKMTAQAQQHGGLYAQTAQDALSSANYPLAILASSYAMSLSQPISNMTTQQLNSDTLSITANSTFGIWASQFSNEARFYVQQSQSTSNSSDKLNYATQAYQVALLAREMSSDFSLISSNFSKQQKQFYALDQGQSIKLNLSWSGGTPPYTVVWYASAAPCHGNSSSVYSRSDVNGTSASITVQPTNSTYYCAIVTDSAFNPSTVASLSAYVKVSSPLEIGPLSSAGTSGMAVVSVVGMLEFIIVVLVAAVIILLVATIHLYRFKHSRRTQYHRASHRRRR